MKRTLHLTNPLMHGTDVRAAQEQLVKHGYMASRYVDGYFGSHSARSSEVAKFRLGYAAIDIKPTYGTMLDNFLRGITKLPLEYRERQKARIGISYLEYERQAIRAKIVAIAKWGVDHNPSIHYEQRRPIDGTHHPYQLPLYTDCSGFATLCYEWAGAPDPNGRGFDGLGYTGTLLSHMKPIMLSQIKLADLVVWGLFPGHHVAIATGGIETNNPLLVSHGKEGDPHFVHFLDESKFQPSHVTWLTLREWS